MINVHKFKSGGRNELDKYMKILITKYNLTKNEEKILEFKDIVKEYKKYKKNENKINEKKEKNIEKASKKQEERVIEVDESLNTDKFEFIEKIEKGIKDMCFELLGEPMDGKYWKIKIAKNIYKLEIDDNIDIATSENLDMMIYGKKTVKRDIKLITDYLTKKRKIQKKTSEIKTSKSKESNTEKVRESKKINRTKKEKKETEVEETNIESNIVKDKKELYKTLFGEDSDEETEENQENEESQENEENKDDNDNEEIYQNEESDIDELIVDLEDIEF
jgi:hypothetical protein